MISADSIVKSYASGLEQVDWKEQGEHVQPYCPDLYLFMRWAYKVEKGWYGFALSNAPMVWGAIIDNFLLELDKIAPNFKINQIKLKWGRLCFYVSLNLDENGDADLIKAINDEIGRLETLLYNDALVY